MIDMDKPMGSPMVPCSDMARMFGVILMVLIIAVKLKNARVLKMAPNLTGNF